MEKEILCTLERRAATAVEIVWRSFCEVLFVRRGIGSFTLTNRRPGEAQDGGHRLPFQGVRSRVTRVRPWKLESVSDQAQVAQSASATAVRNNDNGEVGQWAC